MQPKQEEASEINTLTDYKAESEVKMEDDELPICETFSQNSVQNMIQNNYMLKHEEISFP